MSESQVLTKTLNETRSWYAYCALFRFLLEHGSTTADAIDWCGSVLEPHGRLDG